MILCVLAVRDIKADVFGQPMFAPNIGGAVRGFSDEVNRVDPQNTMNKHPGDFEFYELGKFDDSNGTFELLERPRQLAVGSDLIRK